MDDKHTELMNKFNIVQVEECDAEPGDPADLDLLK